MLHNGNLTDCLSAFGFCTSEIYSRFFSSGLNKYDIRTTSEIPQDFMLYLAKPEIMTAIGAQKTFSNCSNDVGLRFTFQGDL